MDSKTPNAPDASCQPSYWDTAPPAYSESASTSFPSSSTSPNYSSQIHSQLSSIGSQIASIETQKSLLKSAQEDRFCSILTSQIQTYLDEFAKSGHRHGTLILIPKDAVCHLDERAQPTEWDHENGGFERLFKVGGKEADGGADGEEWFWKDEMMARRLATCLLRVLQPTTPGPYNKAGLPRPRQAQVASPSVSAPASRSFFRLRKPSTNSVERPLSVEPAASKRSERRVLDQESRSESNLDISIKAEEVVFRTENAFGIFGTETGWGIILRLKVLAGKEGSRV